MEVEEVVLNRMFQTQGLAGAWQDMREQAWLGDSRGRGE